MTRPLYFICALCCLSLVYFASPFQGVRAEGPLSQAPSHSFLGSYLAGRLASGRYDTEEAASYMRRALDYEPGNRRILEQAFLLELMGGRFEASRKLANKLIVIDPSHPFARLYRGIDEFKSGHHQQAELQFAAGQEGPLGGLISHIVRAWMLSDQGKLEEAVALLKKKTEVNWVRDYYQYQRALILDVNNQTERAEKAYARLYRKYHQMVRLVGSYAQFLAKAGQKDKALKVLNEHFKKSPLNHPDLVALRKTLLAGDVVEPFVRNSKEGVAEVFFSLGDRRGNGAAIDDGLIFLQLARFLRSDFAAADFSLANLLYGAKKYDRAIVLLNNIPADEPTWLDAQILKAQNLKDKGATARGIEVLKRLAAQVEKNSPAVLAGADAHDQDSAAQQSAAEEGAQGPSSVEEKNYIVKSGDSLWSIAKALFGDGERYKDIFQKNKDVMNDQDRIYPGQELVIVLPLNGLRQARVAAKKAPPTVREFELPKAHSNLLQVYNALARFYLDEKKYKNASESYSKAISLLGQPASSHWFYFYGRGISYERQKTWALAEQDFKRALQLNPNRADVMNYLGYSWVDQNLHLKEALALISKAVQLKPNSGYYVDSLGWAYYRLGQYKRAVGLLEKAVTLQPDDPVINDHLGDVYWRVGRHLEAKYQWKQTLSLKPEKELVDQIQQKLATGLTDKQQAKVLMKK